MIIDQTGPRGKPTAVKRSAHGGIKAESYDFFNCVQMGHHHRPGGFGLVLYILFILREIQAAIEILV